MPPSTYSRLQADAREQHFTQSDSVVAPAAGRRRGCRCRRRRALDRELELREELGHRGRVRVARQRSQALGTAALRVRGARDASDSAVQAPCAMSLVDRSGQPSHALTGWLRRRAPREGIAPAPQPWHHRTAEASLARLGVAPERGLDEEEVERRRSRVGRNTLTVRHERPALVRFLLQFHAPLVYILLVATAATLLLRDWIDSAVIFGVVFVNAVIGFLQEAKALQAIHALAHRLAGQATVLREGDERRIPSAELVPGDIVVLLAGDKVPADLRLVRARELRVDESLLTGESIPVAKHTDPVPFDALLSSRHDMAYATTLVTYGQARGVVVETGDRTEIGRISRLMASAEELATPLTRKLAWFSRVLLVAIAALAAVSFVVGTLRGESAQDMLLASVALAVGAIPEGLPAALTIILAIGVARMARRGALIRKLPAVETLGSTTVICSDKTGTLTENQMTVQEMATVDDDFDVTGVGWDPSGRVVSRRGGAGSESAALREGLVAAALCNDAKLERVGGRWEVQGDPTEASLLVAARKVGLDEARERLRMPRLDEVPFESHRQLMATLHEAREGRPRVVFVKGATERLLPLCSDALDRDGERVPLDAQAMHARAGSMASRGLRVLAIARTHVGAAQSSLAGDLAGLTLLAVAGMIDPPRPEAIAAIAACRSAGIHVKMITGDSPLTAAAVAARVGLADAGTPLLALNGHAIEAMSDEDLERRVDDVGVFARVTPEHKLRLVRALQARGHVVAMTGDGVNDAPALKRANIGVAMGLSGTDVAKEASDMVITDDNFASIAAAVEEGRGVFENLMKFIVWTIPTNVGEGLVVLAAVAAAVPLPILPTQVLWLNMSTALLLGLMLAFEPKDRDAMKHPPRAPRAPLLDLTLVLRTVLVVTILLVAAFGTFEYEQTHGATVAAARTSVVNTFVAVESTYLFSCRSLRRSVFQVGLLSNPLLLAGVGAMVALQLLFTYATPMNEVFGSAPIDLDAWARVVAAGVAAYVVVGFEKWARRRWTLGHRHRGAIKHRGQAVH
jgi:Ca2+-transporting ATPase